MKIFDILGPIMIGPSSSHTAGACRIAKMARVIVSKDFSKVIFNLHGSFAETYLGHGTDKALLAGVMGFAPDDERIRDAYKIAEENKINYKFNKTNIEGAHPNTVKIDFVYPDGNIFYVTGSSIGGGSIVIVDINSTKVNFTGDYPTFIIKYKEQKGIISFISTILADNNYNIESLRTIKEVDDVSLIIEVDTDVEDEIKNRILNDTRFYFSKFIVSK